MRLIPILLSSAVVLLFIGIVVYCIQPKTKIVLFDVEVIQAQLIRQLAEHQVADEHVQRTTLKFKEALQRVLTQYAKRHDVVILDRHGALAGGEDITGALTYDLSRAMRAQS
ncbi:TPA: TrbI F-type domain-containing protein [Legionella anisa]